MKGIQHLLRLASSATGVALLVASVILAWPHATSAQYVSNNLIADSIFLNANSMNQSQIQTFLANRGGYLARYQLVFDCASTGTASNNAYVAAGAPCGQTVYASTIIYYAAQVYGLNPQAIMATLQKEQSLITATNPTSSQLNFAMGYGCADSTGCANNSGFLHQVDDATWQFRMNYERSWGNNSWWNSQFHYACPGATKYYSTGLYPGRNVTFYDDYGTAYTSFVINDGATASLYCYTPHAYPGSASKYYSGSYNFVTAFENWFGSTQPAIEITSPLRVSTSPQGVFAGAPTTASFDMVNTTNSSTTVNVAVTVRDPNGANRDYSLKSIWIPAHGTATYSDTQTFSAEGTYHFGLTSLSNGVWNDGYPASSNIDNARTSAPVMQNMPTVTTSPSLGAADMRADKAVNVSFTVKNNSAQSFNVGQLALAVRNSQGKNMDMPLVNSGTLAAGATYTYSQSFVPPVADNYSFFVASTRDGGANWGGDTYPASASGIQRSVTIAAKPNPTVTVSLQSSNATPHVGQTSTLTFTVKNWGDSSVNLGYLGLGGRNPAGQNIDPGVVPVTLAAGETKVMSFNTSFTSAGTYSYSIISTSNFSSWGTGPTGEDGGVGKALNFSVLPNPTVTVAPAISPASPRVGQQATGTFTLHNYGASPASVGAAALAVRGPNGKNADFSLQAITVQPGADYVYSVGNVFKEPGTYTAWITDTPDGGRTWNDTNYPAMESSEIARKITFTVLPNPTVTVSLQSSNATPHVGQTSTLTFTVKNWGDSSVNLGYLGLGGRNPAGQNIDPGVVPVTLAAGETKVMSFNTSFTSAGTYSYSIISTSNFSSWGTGPTGEDGAIAKQITLNVAP